MPIIPPFAVLQYRCGSVGKRTETVGRLPCLSPLLCLVEVLVPGVAVFVLRLLRPGHAQAGACRPATPDALPVLQPHVVGTRPLAGRGLVTLIEMFFDASFCHTYCSFPLFSFCE